MRKNINQHHVEGKIYQHDLELKEVKNQQSANFGKMYIAGKLEVAVDDKALNVLPVEFTFVTATTKTGGVNKTYNTLMKIMSEGKTWIKDGPDAATKVSIDTSLALNDFVASDDSMVSQTIMNGGFVSIIPELNENPLTRNTFRTDMVINNISRVEATEENHLEKDHVVVRGGVFNFKNDLLPVEFVVKSEDGMTYFESLDATQAEPLYTQVWGNVNFMTVSTPTVVESAFGGPAVDNRPRKVKEWVITGALKVPYEFGDEKVMTKEELETAIQNRQVHLAGVRKQREEYLATKNSAAPATPGFAIVPSPTAGPAVKGKFSF